MKIKRRTIKKYMLLAAMLLVSLHPVFAQQKNTKAETDRQKKEAVDQLGKALDYFVSKKYHECLMIMQELNRHYQLNPRYKAYLGVCYYYEWEYKKATKCLDEVISQLDNFAPHERSFYYWADAESHFNQQEYTQAIPLYQQMLPICYANEKPDVYYRIGFCYLFAEDWGGAWNNLLKARVGYRELRNTPDMQARITQVDHMLNGLKSKVVGLVINQLTTSYWRPQTRRAANP